MNFDIFDEEINDILGEDANSYDTIDEELDFLFNEAELKLDVNMDKSLDTEIKEPEEKDSKDKDKKEEDTKEDKPEEDENNDKEESDQEQSDSNTSDTEDSEEESDPNPEDGDTALDNNNDDGETEGEPAESIEESKERYIYFSYFSEIVKTTEIFIERLDTIIDSYSNDESKTILKQILNELYKQKDDLNFLLNKKVQTMSIENLKGLSIVFKSKSQILVELVEKITNTK